MFNFFVIFKHTLFDIKNRFLTQQTFDISVTL